MNRFRGKPLFRALLVLPLADRKKLTVVAIIQILMGGLDLIGVLAVGLLAAVSFSGLQSEKPEGFINQVLQTLYMGKLDFQTQAALLALIALFFLVGRTVLSIFVTRRILYFLSQRGAKISAEMIARLLSKSLFVIQSRTTQETLFAVTTGVERLVLQVISTFVIWISDASLLIIMTIGLLLVDTKTTVVMIGVFSLVGYLLYKFMQVKAESLGLENSQLNISSNEKIVEVLASYRESIVRNRRDYYAREIQSLRHSLARTSAEISFLPYVSKYVIETSVLVAAILIGAIQFLLQDTTEALATVAIFLTAGTRITPAVLRLQQGLITIKNGLGISKPTLDLIEELGDEDLAVTSNDLLDILHVGFVPEIVISNASLTYPGSFSPAIKGVTLKIPSGSSVAFVGPSGAGKTTAIDVILGVLTPDAGFVEISGLAPQFAVAKWPGAISYVPQDVVISAGTIRENVSQGYSSSQASEDLVNEALIVARLDSFVKSLPNGIETYVGERGTRLSGGQRQRLGIARAMFTNPKLLVLDEATSSLDAETEESLSSAIQSLKGKTTVVLIAHRLSTVRNVDLVVYLSEGKVQAAGSFEEVRRLVPNFDKQAKIMGL
jgi:ABC-type multidrug transport system fused ATPase/permease subunit